MGLNRPYGYELYIFNRAIQSVEQGNRYMTSDMGFFEGTNH